MPKRKRRNITRSFKKNKYQRHKNIRNKNKIIKDNINKNEPEINKVKNNINNISTSNEKIELGKNNIIKDFTNLYEFNKIFIEGDTYKKNIVSNVIINKKISPDGNCFYNAISYYFNLTEEYNTNYREIIYELCNNDINEIKELFHSDYDDEESNERDRINKAKEYINNIKKNATWAGDIEINKMAELLEMNILCYTQNEINYILQAVYFGTNNKINLIPLKFVNNNHFEILYPKNYFIPFKKIEIEEVYINKRIKECKIKKNKKDIKSIPEFFKIDYVEYKKS